MKRKAARPLVSLEAWNANPAEGPPAFGIGNGIACPKCGSELQDADAFLRLSEPPKKAIVCPECSFTGFAPVHPP